nr:MAG TPA: hypothetical protein [Caudoviricetes sp.]
MERLLQVTTGHFLTQQELTIHVHLMAASSMSLMRVLKHIKRLLRVTLLH